ncbi:ABC transporter permease [Sphaerimonospora sp. CA-214678]|uniref:ABC transporter permease n=1 Tax=Sphaerimonospora sp. CA-214678 TaxID=3240029 RepID=UPI003D8E1610
MIWLTWRQFRAQATAMYGLLAVLAVVLVIAGRPPHGVVRLAPADSRLYYAGVVVMYLLPAVIGVFWGAPLVTRELEAGTHRLVWNQSVTRARWLATKLAFTGLAAMAAAGSLSLLVTWWAGPVDAASRPATIPVGADTVTGMPDPESFAARISPLLFGARGIAPIGYTAFAFVAGVAAGILLRRTVPAMAVMLAAFAAVQIAVPFAVRPYVIPAIQETVTITAENISKVGVNSSGEVEELAVAGPPGAWVLGNETVDAAGRPATVPSWAAACLLPPPLEQASPSGPVIDRECLTRLADLGYRQRVTYQPAGRFWALQGIETAIFLALSALAARLCLRWIRSRLS